MINKKLSDVCLEDIESLTVNEVEENKTLEYKKELHLETHEQKREFLADVTAFANTNGGDLIFGIAEDQQTQLPSSIQGVQVENTDEFIRKIENLIRDGVQPRIPKIEPLLLPKEDGTFIFILRIAQSFLAPHRVTLSGHDKFYARNSKGKYPMDVSELRTAFVVSQTITQQIDLYKKEKNRRGKCKPISYSERQFARVCFANNPPDRFHR